MIDSDWFKSSYSRGGADNCVECRTGRGRVFIRDTQHRDLVHLALPAREWASFLAEVKAEGFQ